jgi:hypothetical protein
LFFGHADGDFAVWLRDRRNARRIPHRLEACGYVAVRNDAAKDGLWKVNGRRQVIYAKSVLPLRWLRQRLERDNAILDWKSKTVLPIDPTRPVSKWAASFFTS